MNKDTEDRDRKSNPVSDTSTLGEDWIEQELREEALTSDDPPCLPAINVTTRTQTVDVMISPPVPSCDISTQTTCQTADVSVQTFADNSEPKSKTSSSSNQVNPDTSSTCNLQEVDCHPPVCLAPQEVNLRECFLKITKERQHHYSSIRSKLDHMVTLLSQKRELVDLTNLTLRPGLHRGRKGQQESRQVHSTLDNAIMGTWPRPRCLQ